jgi:lysozyme family protein
MTHKQERLINMILQHEGGYANVTGDAGGMTYKGIARNCHPKWEGWQLIDSKLPLKHNQIIKSSELDSLVMEFYLKKFYNPCEIDNIDDFQLSGHIICHAVNAGIRPTIKMLQKTINKVYKTEISVDGKIGKQTLQYCNEKKTEELVKQFIIERNAFYTKIVKNKPSQKKFLKGWLNRVKNTTRYCS